MLTSPRPRPSRRLAAPTRRRVDAWLAAALLLTGLSAACDKAPNAAPAVQTTPSPAEGPRFADSAGPATADRPPQDLTLDSGRTLRASFWRFAPRSDRSQARVAFWCGVGLDGRLLTVIGVDITEALSCDGLSEAGALPGGRIGLIYRTASPNAKSLTALVLTDRGGAWAVDTDLTEQLWERSPASLAQLRKMVR